MKATALDKAGIDLIALEEGCILHPYLDTLKIPTIGIGATHYEDGKRVSMQDPPITLERAHDLFMNLSKFFQMGVDSITRDDITQNQFNALCSFCYNGGTGMLKSSHLLAKVNVNPNDPTIRDEFMKFVYGHQNGVPIRLHGLEIRRTREIQMYFKA